jgi:oligoribonuclease NrnB/cAMP/cGMP phosphodiesterase (DHH superfamily)
MDIKSDAAAALISELDIAFVHDPCPDGLACAYLLLNHHQQMEGMNKKKAFKMLPWKHGVTTIAPNSFSNLRVGFFDCCPPTWESLSGLAKSAKHVLVMDHHDTTARMIKEHEQDMPKQLAVLLDMHHCGAVLVWKALHNHHPGGQQSMLPHWLELIQLKDLGKSMSTEQQDEHLFLAHDLTTTDDLSKRIALLDKDRKEAQDAGCMIRLKMELEVAALWSQHESGDWKVGDTTYRVVYVPVANPSHTAMIFRNHFLKSTTASLQVDKDILACIWFDDEDHKTVNMALRASEANPVNLAKLVETVRAKGLAISGGGHAKAAGIKFVVPRLCLPNA